jgi:hypothetical protein
MNSEKKELLLQKLKELDEKVHGSEGDEFVREFEKNGK